MEASERQARLAQKLAEFRQRSQLKEAHQLAIALGIPLERCQVFLPNQARSKQLEEWLGKSFPWQFGQIDWQRVTNSICMSWHKNECADLVFRELCQAQQLSNTMVNVVWSSAHRPILEMDLNRVKITLSKIVAEDWDTWIFDPQAGWCIEFYHEGTMCYGKAINIDTQ
ncbi:MULTISPECIES: hypothetical protein [Pseudanabaena]|uniref:Uncharacterized protein n=2 Tax=Pseudanabaena TaxID=1152 RepID=L8MSF0_9CYAN|nr:MULTISPECIES: hypothetical protein [Pseudanabaena]ELS30371.1 hypothetical protein Pse7429DRAFT_4489 [Pseudanabaena biceps PCC 7429]MDG3497350.1 hypothetical protein [Pseudanabaena catenata USMAC16]